MADEGPALATGVAAGRPRGEAGEPAGEERPPASPRPENETTGAGDATSSLDVTTMRLMALAAILLPLSGTLSGCVTNDGIDEALDLEAPVDDAHCQSLLMRPGELVYAQCRLAMRKTYLNDYNARKAVIQSQYGPVTGGFDVALRADAFCNYDESVKQVTLGLSDDVVAENAYQACATTREDLSARFAEATGQPGTILLDAERPTILQQNRAAIGEARVVIKGPPGSVLVSESEVAVQNAPGLLAPAGVIPPAPLGQ